MDVTTSYWRDFSKFVQAQRRRSRRRTTRLLARAVGPPPARKSSVSLALAPLRRDTRFTIH